MGGTSVVALSRHLALAWVRSDIITYQPAKGIKTKPADFAKQDVNEVDLDALSVDTHRSL